MFMMREILLQIIWYEWGDTRRRRWRHSSYTRKTERQQQKQQQYCNRSQGMEWKKGNIQNISRDIFALFFPLNFQCKEITFVQGSSSHTTFINGIWSTTNDDDDDTIYPQIEAYFCNLKLLHLCSLSPSLCQYWAVYVCGMASRYYFLSSAGCEGNYERLSCTTKQRQREKE